MKLFILFLLIFPIQSSFASGCYSTYLKGSNSGFGAVPLYSSIFLGTSSLLLATEGESGGEKSKKEASAVGGVVSGLYFYFALHGLCRSVDKEKYDELKLQKEKLLESGVAEKDLPFELRTLKQIPSRTEYESMIDHWKSYQKKLLFIVGILDSALLIGNAEASTRDGVKIYSYGAVAGILGMAIFDIDNLWNDESPSWVKFDILSTKVENRFVPVASLRFEF